MTGTAGAVGDGAEIVAGPLAAPFDATIQARRFHVRSAVTMPLRERSSSSEPSPENPMGIRVACVTVRDGL